jgi:uncharacterized repeat protein (TIGR03803 family)
VPEQLVCAVHEIDFQGAAPTKPYRTGIVYINQRTPLTSPVEFQYGETGDPSFFDASGNLYGTTYEGTTSNSDWAADGCGTVFQLMPANGTWTEKILYSFHGKDGGLPYAGLISDSAGNLYGTTTGGGAYGNGTVFEITEW